MTFIEIYDVRHSFNYIIHLTDKVIGKPSILNHLRQRMGLFHF
jgi:hypothetical protein